MKKLLGTLITISLLMTPVSHSEAATKKVVEKPVPLSQLVGRLLVEKGTERIWYAEPVKKTRYIIRDDADLEWLRENLATTLKAADLGSIPIADSQNKKSYLGKYRGRIVVGANDPQHAWYIYPETGKRYAFDSFTAVQQLAKDKGSTITQKSLAQLAMTKKQIMFDPLFSSVASVRYDGDHFSNGINAKTILPLASLTKLMTALVLLDLKPDFDTKVTVTADEIKYPKTVVGDDATSEIPLKAGDSVALRNLWTSLLLASSNQSAVILADNSGVTRSEFIQRMNDKAKSFGLTKTKFYEVAGLDANNVSTAEEMAIIAHRAFSYYTIVEATSHTSYSFDVTDAQGTSRTIVVRNRNYSLLGFEPQASKTGFLVEAQRNVVLKKNGEIIVVLHARSMSERNGIIKKLIAS